MSIDIKNLEYKRESALYTMNDAQQAASHEFSKGYIRFLNHAKTEREAVSEMVKEAESKGFSDFQKIIERGGTLEPGTKLYWVNRGKALILAVVGKDHPIKGCSMVGAHLDSPRLDFRPNPLYEDHGFALAKTHYYGGIKKYQWVSLPLAIHGVISKSEAKRS